MLETSSEYPCKTGLGLTVLSDNPTTIQRGMKLHTWPPELLQIRGTRDRNHRLERVSGRSPDLLLRKDGDHDVFELAQNPCNKCEEILIWRQRPPLVLVLVARPMNLDDVAGKFGRVAVQSIDQPIAGPHAHVPRVVGPLRYCPAP